MRWGRGFSIKTRVSNLLLSIQEKLLEQVHYHLTGNDDLDSCAVPYCISHQCFALNILERVSYVYIIIIMI